MGPVVRLVQHHPGLTGGSGGGAAIDSDWYGSGPLIDGELLGLPAYYGYTQVVFEVDIPVDLSLLGFTLCTQGAGAGGADGLKFHNAYDLILGS